MDLREMRGMEIAATRTIRKQDGWYKVPSQNGPGLYRVQIAKKFSTCECPDFAKRQTACKHVYAATFVMKREQGPDGTTTVTQSVTFTEAHEISYSQPWSAYNAAQTSEQDRFQSLLHDLCSGLSSFAEPQKSGRPRLPLSDAVFNIAFKVYSTVSQRRFMSDLREAHRRGYISKVPHFNSISNYLDNPELTSLLQGCIVKTSLPLQSVETDFAVDSSGFTTCRFHRWFDHKYGEIRQQHDWVKCHLMVGVKTNVVTAVEILGRNTNDSKQLPALVNATAQNFQIREVSADKGYASKANVEAITSVGAVPFISVKDNQRGIGGGNWERMYHYFQFRKPEFLQHYHKRSNVESAFSMMKRKFGDSLRSKGDTAMVNEALCKILCHNLVVLIHEMHELGIEPEFWPQFRTIA